MSILSRAAGSALLATSAVALFSAAPVQAQNASENEVVVTSVGTSKAVVTRSVHVPISDLQLTDGRDYARLNHRVARAADAVCQDDGLWNTFQHLDYARCRGDAIASAMTRSLATQAGSD